MSDIHPTSIALLAVLGATAAVIALDLAVRAARRWWQARRWRRADEDVVIDLTYLQQAVRRTEEASQDLRAHERGSLR